MRIVMLHENDPERDGCAFARFFQTTPDDLINGGLYDALALAMHAGDYRHVSLLIVAQALGAQTAFSRSKLSPKCLFMHACSKLRGSDGSARASAEMQPRCISETGARSSGSGSGSSSSLKKSRGRSALRSLVFGSAAFQTAAFWNGVYPFSASADQQRPIRSLLLLPGPPSVMPSFERVLHPRTRRALEFLTVQQPDTYYRDDTISFVNVDPIRQTAVSCECTRQVQVSLHKTEAGVLSQDLDLVVAQDPRGPLYRNWTVIDVTNVVPRPVQLVSFGSRAGAVTGAGVQMRFAAYSISEVGLEAGYGASVQVNISQAGGGDDVDVPFDIAVEVLATAVANQTVWGNIPAMSWCNETKLDSNSSLLPSRPAEAMMPIVFGVKTEIPFTACDIEGLPLLHSNPITRVELSDPRSFTAALRELSMSDSTVIRATGDSLQGDSLQVLVDSPTSGRYVATVQPERLGIYSLELYLGVEGEDRESATPALGALRLEIVCPDGLVPDPIMRICSCDKGFEPSDERPDTVCKPCDPGHYKPNIGADQCAPCPAGQVQPQMASVTCETCLPGTFQHVEGSTSCERCAEGTNSTYPYESCEICEAGHFRLSETMDASTETCRPCIAGASCPFGSTTLPTIYLEPGTWRLGERSRFIQLCVEGDNGTTPCLGGREIGNSGDGYCAPGHTGPMCEICVESGYYFSWADAQCAKCPSPARFVLIYELVIGIPLLIAAAIYVAHGRSARVRAASTRAAAIIDALNIEGKLKAFIGFVQVVAVIGPVYSIEMPNLYRAVLRALEVVYIDIFGDLFIPTECIGGYQRFLIVKATFPIILIAVAATLRGLLWLHQKWRLRDDSPSTDEGGRRTMLKCVSTTGISLLPLILWMGIFFCVTVSASIFRALHCVRFVYDSEKGQYREFISESLDIECPTSGHPASKGFYQLRAVAVFLVGVWPVGCLLGLALLLWAVRKQVLSRRPSKLSHAARVLTRDYKPAFFWWDFVELVRKLFLTGFVLIVPESAAFLRLVLALLFSVLFLIGQTMLAPFKDRDQQVFSLGLQSVVIVLFLGSTYMYAYEQFDVAIANGGAAVAWQEGRLSPLADVFVFQSLDDLALICLVGMCVLAGALVLLAIHAAFVEGNAEVLKLKRTRAPPVITIRQEHQYHLFLSHVWSTGQDQVAVIKRQLLRMVHGMKIFLDVDDLQDIGALEAYIDETMVVLVFLSRGYFTSRNCLREARASMQRNKPILLVHETDASKGGFTLEEARAECPEDLRDFMFGPVGYERPIIPWHRITVFQLCTLKEIARNVLRQTPLYSSKPMLGVYLDRDVNVDQLKMSKPVAIYASPNNPGSEMVAKELAAFFPETEICVVQAPLEGMLHLGSASDDLQSIDIDLAHDAAIPAEPGASTQGAEDMRGPSSSDASSARSARRVRRPMDDLRKRKQIFLLYLNRHTFVGHAGESLAREVSHALNNNLNIVMLHENDRRRAGCEFGHFLKTTPRELIDLGLYGPIALAMYPMPHREVSLTLVAQTLGGVKKSRAAAVQGSTPRKYALEQQTQQSWLKRQTNSLGRGLSIVPADPPPPPREPKIPPRRSTYAPPRAPKGPLPTLSERKLSKQPMSSRMSAPRMSAPRAVSIASSAVSWMADYDDWDWESAYEDDSISTLRDEEGRPSSGPSGWRTSAPRHPSRLAPPYATPLSPIQSPGGGGPRVTSYDGDEEGGGRWSRASV